MRMTYWLRWALLATVLCGCSNGDWDGSTLAPDGVTGLEQGIEGDLAATDGAPPAEDAGPPPAPADSGVIPSPDGAIPQVGCGPTPLSLDRFPEAQRTTADGRTFSGWGGAATPGVAQKPPVVLIHGNGGAANDWLGVRNALCKQGYSDSEIWAITFQNNDCSGYCYSGSNTEHATELEQMVKLVRGQTQAPRVSLVAASMGVPAARYYLKFLGGLQRDEVALAYLVSGPNHGLADCDIPGAAMINVACAELTSATLVFGWQYDLNNPDETPNGQGDGLPPAKTVIYRTVSFTGDPFFPGLYVSSPKLDGADNLVQPGNKHAVIYVDDMLNYLGKATPSSVP